MTRFRLSHRTSYVYATRVDISHHVLHLDARSLPTQRVTRAAIDCRPEAARRSAVSDHFGNRVTHLTIEAPHDRFEIMLEAEGDLHVAPRPATTPSWEEVRRALAGDGLPLAVAASEFALDSPLAAATGDLRALALESFAAGRPILDATIDLTTAIHRGFRYDPTATEVSTPLAEVVAKRAGVCQDFAHVEIAALRSLGLAARYVSGYVATRPPGDATALRGADASHAWTSVWCGDEVGWVDLDPTNDLVVSDAHVVAAWGRDYADVSPVRGVLIGGGAHSLSVAVDLQLEPASSLTAGPASS